MHCIVFSVHLPGGCGLPQCHKKPTETNSSMLPCCVGYGVMRWWEFSAPLWSCETTSANVIHCWCIPCWQQGPGFMCMGCFLVVFVLFIFVAVILAAHLPFVLKLGDEPKRAQSISHLPPCLSFLFISLFVICLSVVLLQRSSHDALQTSASQFLNSNF